MNFTFDDFRDIVYLINRENHENCNSFSKALCDNFENLEPSDLDNILSYLYEEFGVDSDYSIFDMSLSEIKHFSQFMSDYIDNM